MDQTVRPIDANALYDALRDNEFQTFCPLDEVDDVIASAPTLDYAPVVRCKDCAYYKKAHVLLNDGTERDYMPEDFTHDPFRIGVTADVGINIGGMCKRDTGYDEDKSVFRNPDDFCSRGAKMDGGKKND